MSPDGDIRDGAPENIAALLEKKKWTNIKQLVDNYVELEKHVGGDPLLLPGEDDPDADAKYAKIWNALGRPEDATGYELNYDGDLEISDELNTQFKQFAHKLGLNSKQYQEVVGFQLDAIAEQRKAIKARNVAKLKQDFGEANYEAKVKDSRIIADKHGFYQDIEAEDLGSSPAVIKLLDHIAKLEAEDGIRPGSPPTPDKSPQQELDELKKSKSFLDKFDRDHKKTMARFMELNQIIADSGQARMPRY
jgi:hypothetical protein